jgi:hypothetical protein
MPKYKKATYEPHRGGIKYSKAKLNNPKYLKNRELKAKCKKNTHDYIKASLSAMKMLSEEKVNLFKLNKALNTGNQLKHLDQDFLRCL